MLFAVTMDVQIPDTLDDQVRGDLIAREKAYSHELQRGGEWVHIWRKVGQYSNLSVFDVDSNERLHEILWGLPLFPYMAVDVTPLATHPSDVALVAGDGA